jgi:hypothetical protein
MLTEKKMRSKSFGRECLEAFLKYAQPTPGVYGTILLGISEPPGGPLRRDQQVAKRKMKDQAPVERE